MSVLFNSLCCLLRGKNSKKLMRVSGIYVLIDLLIVIAFWTQQENENWQKSVFAWIENCCGRDSRLLYRFSHKPTAYHIPPMKLDRVDCGFCSWYIFFVFYLPKQLMHNVSNILFIILNGSFHEKKTLLNFHQRKPQQLRFYLDKKETK